MNNHSKNNGYFQFSTKREVFQGIGSLIFIYGATMLVAFRPLHKWNFTHWLFSYEETFVKRGLQGEILRLLGVEVSFELIFVISLFIILALHVLLIPLFSQPLRVQDSDHQNWKQYFSAGYWKNRPFKTGLIFFFMMTLFHSSTMQRIIRYPGAPEQLQLIIVLVCLWLIRKIAQSKPMKTNSSTSIGTTSLHFTLVIITSLTCLLIHEGFLLFYLPLIFGYWIYEVPGNPAYNTGRFFVFCGLIICTWMISANGLLTSEEFKTVADSLRDQYGGRFDARALNVLVKDFNDNIEFTQNWLTANTVVRITELLFFLIVISPTAYVFSKIYKADFKRVWAKLFIRKGRHFENEDENTRTTDLENKAVYRFFLLVCSLSPLAMIPFAIDLYRWFAISLLNLFIITVIFLGEKHFRERAADIFKNQRYIIGLAIALSLIFGPLRDIHSYHWVVDVITTLNLSF